MPQKQSTTRVGLIGYGQIGTAVRDMIDKDPDNGMEIVFIHDQDAGRLDGLGDLALPDQVVEVGVHLALHVVEPWRDLPGVLLPL